MQAQGLRPANRRPVDARPGGGIVERVGANSDHLGRGAGFGVSLGFFPGVGREETLAKVAAVGTEEAGIELRKHVKDVQVRPS